MVSSLCDSITVWLCVLCRWQWAAAVTVISDRVPFLVAKRVVAVEKDSTSAKERVYLLMTRALRKAQRSRSSQLCSMYRPSSTSCVAFVYRRTVSNCPYSKRKAPSGTSPIRYWRASRLRWVSSRVFTGSSCRDEDKSDATICGSRTRHRVSLSPTRAPITLTSSRSRLLSLHRRLLSLFTLLSQGCVCVCACHGRKFGKRCVREISRLTGDLKWQW